MTGVDDERPAEGEADARRWVTLAIVILAALISSLDSTVLNVAIPSILRDFHSDLPSVQWVVSGYSLTFATLLIIGGRLGDVYGHRRVFIVGVILFGAGSLLASLAPSIAVLLLGEAFIEGVGAALMMPATTAILSTTFHGRERATAFGWWGATIGAAAAFGPIVGGYLTTEYSWRWALRINVFVAPAAAIGALVFMQRDIRRRERAKLDVPGALLVGTGMLLLVFGLSEGPTYGWLVPRRDFTVDGLRCWPATNAVSVIPIAFVVALALLWCFVRLERHKERSGGSPLFELGQLEHRGYRYGLLTSTVVALAQLGLIFVLPIVLQDGKHLSALDTGLWLVPFGVFIIVGAQLGGRLTRLLATTSVVRIGLVLEAMGLCAVAAAVSPHITVIAVIPGFGLFGVGYGFASAQLVNIILSDVPRDKAGVAGAANATVRQVGAALGVAVVGALLNTLAIRRAIGLVARSGLAAPVRAEAVEGLHRRGVNYLPPVAVSPRDASRLSHILSAAITSGARPALLFAASAALGGALVSLLIPQVATGRRRPAIDVVPPQPAAGTGAVVSGR